MTNQTDQLHKDIGLIKSVLLVRKAALDIARDDLNADLYHTAVSDDDAGILEYFEGLLAEAVAEVEITSVALEGSVPFEEHMRTMARIAKQTVHVATLTVVRDAAQANVDLLTSGEVCYPPASKSTEQLLTELAVLVAKLETAEKETAEV